MTTHNLRLSYHIFIVQVTQLLRKEYGMFKIWQNTCGKDKEIEQIARNAKDCGIFVEESDLQTFRLRTEYGEKSET